MFQIRSKGLRTTLNSGKRWKAQETSFNISRDTVSPSLLQARYVQGAPICDGSAASREQKKGYKDVMCLPGDDNVGQAVPQRDD